MKKALRFFLLIAAMLLLQLVVRQFFPGTVAAPNLMLMLTVSVAFMRGRHAGILVGLASGLFTDLFFGGSLFGLHPLLFTYIGYACGFFGKKFFDNDLKMPLLLVAASDLLYGTAVYAAEALLRRGLNFPVYFGRTIFPEMVATVLLTIPLYPLIRLINQKISAREIEEQNSPWLRR